MEAIARQGELVYLLPVGDGFAGRVLDLEQRLLSAPAPLVSLLRRGPWEAGSFEVADSLLDTVEVVPEGAADGEYLARLRSYERTEAELRRLAS